MPQTPRACTQEELDKRIVMWHDEPDDGVELHHYLGWTWDEYKYWFTTGYISKE